MEAVGDVSPVAFETDTESGEYIIDTSAGGEATETTYNLDLFGSEEVPGPGADLDGPLRMELTLRTAGGDEPAQGCIRTLAAEQVTLSDLPGDITGLHVHAGGAGENGPVVVDLQGVVDTIDQDAVVACTDLVADVAPILEQPFNFYLNLHTTEFPDGAVRSQLIGPNPEVPASDEADEDETQTSDGQGDPEGPEN